MLDALGVYRDIDAAAAALEPSGEEFYATSWQPGYPDEDPVSIKTSRVSGQLEVEFEAPTVSAMRRLLLKMHDALLGLLDKVVPEATMQDKQVVSWDRRTKGKVVGYDRATGLCAVRSVESGEEATLHASLLEVDTSLLASGTAPTDATEPRGRRSNDAHADGSILPYYFYERLCCGRAEGWIRNGEYLP